MKNTLSQFCDEILGLAKKQKKALLDNRIEEAITIFGERQKLVEQMQTIHGMRIQDLTSKDTRGNTPRADNSSQIHGIIKKILNLDEEITSIIKQDLQTITREIQTVQKLKNAFCRGGISRQPGKTLNISV
jgi:hypothetical protein